MSTKVIVVGAGMAGQLAARALADRVDEVHVLERDEPLDGTGPRRGVPQGRHAHALLAAGEQRIASWFPGIIDELVEIGAVREDGGLGLWHQAGAVKVMAEVGVIASCVSRPALEAAVRRRLLGVPNVTIDGGARADSLIVDRDTVRGVTVAGAPLYADFVVDCSGRNTRLLAGLEASGFPSPATSVVEVGIAYATRLLARTPGDLAVPFVVVAATPPFQNRAGVLLPVEGSRWILTLGGYHGDVPPTDDEGFLDFARSLPTPVIADLVETAEHLSPVMTHRFSSSRRRHFERLRTLPTRFVALGDALASFNPIYGQGMSSAALQADALARVVARNGLDGRATPRRFYRQAARAVDTAWKIAVGSDFMHPATRGPKRPGTDLINRYVGLVQRATHGSPAVLADMLAVQNLLASPRSLIRPSTVARVLLAARRSPAEPASSQLQPAGV